MRIDIIPLARKKIERRKIPLDRIYETVRKPQQTVKGYKGRKVKHRKYYINGKEKLLRIICEEEKNAIVVISAYTTSQIERYWENEN